MDGEAPEEREVALARGPLLFAQAVEKTRAAICLTDAGKPDNPIIYVNAAFEALTGYDRTEVVGRNCRFLQGAGTSKEATGQLRDAVARNEPTTVEILNYRKDGTPFWNALHIAPIVSADGTVTQYYGSQLDVSDAVMARQDEAANTILVRELRHRTANLFSVVNALVSMSVPPGADAPLAALGGTITARIQAMSRAHELSNLSAASGADLRALIGTILRPYETDHAVRLDGPEVRLADRVAGPLGLVLHELATNAVKHGRLTRAADGLTVAWSHTQPLVIAWTEMASSCSGDRDTRAPGTGTQIVDGIIASLGGTIERDWRADGLRVTITLPTS